METLRQQLNAHKELLQKKYDLQKTMSLAARYADAHVVPSLWATGIKLFAVVGCCFLSFVSWATEKKWHSTLALSGVLISLLGVAHDIAVSLSPRLALMRFSYSRYTELQNRERELHGEIAANAKTLAPLCSNLRDAAFDRKEYQALAVLIMMAAHIDFHKPGMSDVFLHVVTMLSCKKAKSSIRKCPPILKTFFDGLKHKPSAPRLTTKTAEAWACRSLGFV